MNSGFVIDTNTLISAFLFPHSVPRKALDRAMERGRPLASPETFSEFQKVFLRPKFDKYVSKANRLLTLQEFHLRLLFTEVTETITNCRDPKDNKFLELAVAAKASCIITGDDDLLVLHPFREIPILNAVGFINKF